MNSAGQMLARVAWHDETADASGVGALARRSARRVVRSSTLRSSTLRSSSSSAAAASERQPTTDRESTICALRVLHGAQKVAKKLQFQAPRQEACRAPGFASPRMPHPRSLPCALHTSTRVQSTLDTHEPRVRASPAVHMLSRGNTRLHVKSLAAVLESLATG